MSSELRESIVGYLAQRFEDEGISRNLLDITMAKVDAEAAAWHSARHPQYPKLSAYPSVAQQISWQHSLRKIAAEFKREFPSGYVPPPLSVQISSEDGVYPPPATDYLLWRIPAMIEGAQGEFSEKFAEEPVARFPGEVGQLYRRFGGWVHSLRITATGEKAIDDRIRAEVTRLSEARADSGIEIDSVAAPPSAANVYIPAAEFGGSVRDSLWLCLGNTHCASIFDIAHVSLWIGVQKEPRYGGDRRLKGTPISMV